MTSAASRDDIYLYLAFVDLTKTVDLVIREGFFDFLKIIECFPKFLSMIISFHEKMKETVQFDVRALNPSSLKTA